MKKLFLIFTLLLLFIFTFVQRVSAEQLYKFTSANFDTSNSVIVLSGQDTQGGAVLNNVKLVKLENPSRAYFDIDNAIITFPRQDWTFNSGSIKQVKINQFSANPNKVRVVLYYDKGFNPDSIKFIRMKNNIIIKLNRISLRIFYRKYSNTFNHFSIYY